jgi:hypothetical protein
MTGQLYFYDVAFRSQRIEVNHTRIIFRLQLLFYLVELCGMRTHHLRIEILEIRLKEISRIIQIDILF